MIFIFMLLTIALFISVIRRIAKVEKRIAEIYAEQAAKPKRCTQCGRFMPADSTGDICNACMDTELDTDWESLQVGDKVLVEEPIGSQPVERIVTDTMELYFQLGYEFWFEKETGEAKGSNGAFAKAIRVVERVKHEKP